MSTNSIGLSAVGNAALSFGINKVVQIIPQLPLLKNPVNNPGLALCALVHGCAITLINILNFPKSLITQTCIATAVGTVTLLFFEPLSINTLFIINPYTIIQSACLFFAVKMILHIVHKQPIEISSNPQRLSTTESPMNLKQIQSAPNVFSQASKRCNICWKKYHFSYSSAVILLALGIGCYVYKTQQVMPPPPLPPIDDIKQKQNMNWIRLLLGPIVTPYLQSL